MAKKSPWTKVKNGQELISYYSGKYAISAHRRWDGQIATVYISDLFMRVCYSIFNECEEQAPHGLIQLQESGVKPRIHTMIPIGSLGLTRLDKMRMLDILDLIEHSPQFPVPSFFQQSWENMRQMAEGIPVNSIKIIVGNIKSERRTGR